MKRNDGVPVSSCWRRWVLQAAAASLFLSLSHWAQYNGFWYWNHFITGSVWKALKITLQSLNWLRHLILIHPSADTLKAESIQKWINTHERWFIFPLSDDSLRFPVTALKLWMITCLLCPSVFNSTSITLLLNFFYSVFTVWIQSMNSRCSCGLQV